MEQQEISKDKVAIALPREFELPSTATWLATGKLFKVIDTFKAKGYSEELDSVIKELRELKVKANGQDTEVDFAFILVGFSEEKEIVNIQFNWVTELKGSDIKNTPEGDERAWEVIDVEKEHYAHGTYAMAFYDGIRLIINMEM